MHQNISKITRRKLVRELLKNYNLCGDLEPMDFLTMVWDLSNMPSYDKRYPDAYADIYTHFISFNDYDFYDLLFDRLDIIDCEDTTFIKFLETIVSPEIRDDKDEQLALVEAINQFIQHDFFKLLHVKNSSGFPIFHIKHLKGNRKEFQQLFFASSGYKHRLVFKDATTNEIDVTKNQDSILCYREPIPPEGLLWTDLVAWYGKEVNIDDPFQAENALIDRLNKSMNIPELIMFETYLEFKNKLGLKLPAYIPQPYLKYDPYTQLERKGNKNLERERMDFLLFFPHGIRILTEVDGKHHYSENNGQSSPKKYANMVREDREDKLMGYEVFRFGGFEFVHSNESEREAVKANIRDFFEKLFKHYGLL